MMSDDTVSEASVTGVSGARGMVDKLKNTIADRLRSAASSIEQKTQHGEALEPFADYGRRAAELLDSCADYVREIDPEQVKTDIENTVRANPGRSLLAAAAAGLMLGILIRRRA